MSAAGKLLGAEKTKIRSRKPNFDLKFWEYQDPGKIPAKKSLTLRCRDDTHVYHDFMELYLSTQKDLQHKPDI